MVNKISEDSVLTDHKRKVRNRHFSLIQDYNSLMSINGAVQKKVFELLAEKHQYSSGECVKITIHNLKKTYPKKFIQNQGVE